MLEEIKNLADLKLKRLTIRIRSKRNYWNKRNEGLVKPNDYNYLNRIKLFTRSKAFEKSIWIMSVLHLFQMIIFLINDKLL